MVRTHNNESPLFSVIFDDDVDRGVENRTETTLETVGVPCDEPASWSVRSGENKTSDVH